MALKRFKPHTPSRRYYTVSDFAEITKDRPEKSLLAPLRKTGARNHFGHATSINKGGGHKRRYRLIDFLRDKEGIAGTVIAVEYDPNRSARIALVQYVDGEKCYIVAPQGLSVGARITSSSSADIKPGNTLPLRNIPLGESVHNVELQPGGGARMVRSAGTAAQLVAKEGEYALLRLPSGEMRNVHLNCKASVGAVSNPEHANLEIGKAGRNRWKGIRPHNRGVSKNPVDHPMGGGQGKTAGGRPPCSRTGVQAKGLKTRNNKRTDKFIVRRRQRKTAN
ncbi:MAG: 50S ribosomal protein L2 [Bdellovibrionota bacterium]|nr:MAG: 50S ribosomal protein L2 [Bdellovibrionota bacterium]